MVASLPLRSMKDDVMKTEIHICHDKHGHRIIDVYNIPRIGEKITISINGYHDTFEVYDVEHYYSNHDITVYVNVKYAE